MNKEMKQFKFFGILIMLVFASATMVSCSSDDDDNEVTTNDLVGTWTRKLSDVGIVGFKITSDGKAYYNEWDKDENWPNFDGIAPGKAKISGNTVTFTHPNQPDYYEVLQGVSSILAGALEGSFHRLRRRKRLCALAQTIVRVGANQTTGCSWGGGGGGG